MKRIVLLVLMLACLVSMAGCNYSREYLEDISVALQDSSEKIIIKEWRFLLGSGAEIYFQKGSDDPVLLGETTGGDDGFCPFNEGVYKITQNERSICISWGFYPNDDPSAWKEKSFALPNP